MSLHLAGQFPACRPRRLRQSPALRALVRETRLNVAQLVLPLFVRAGFGVSGGQSDLQPAMECGTCHDVHNPGNLSFLRISNAQSALCYACHIK